MTLPTFPFRPGLQILIVVLAALGACQPDPAAEPEARTDVVTARPGDTRLDETTALALAALPLACLDRPHTAPSGSSYLYERPATLRPDFETTRSFYGCFD